MDKNIDKKLKNAIMNALESAQSYSLKRQEILEQRLWREITFPCNIYDTVKGLTKDEMDNIRKKLDLKNLSALKKADLASELARQIPAKYEMLLRMLDKGRYGLIKEIVKKSGIISGVHMTTAYIEPLMEHGLVFPGIFNNKQVIYTPIELIDIFLRIDGAELEQIIERNTEWIMLTNGYLYYYGVAEVWPIKEKISSITSQEIDFLEYMNVMSFAVDCYGQVRFSEYGFKEQRVFDAGEITKEHRSRPDIDFYPFTKKQLLTAGAPGYIEKTPAMNSLINFLLRHYELKDEHINEIAIQLNNMIVNEAETSTIYQYLQSLLEFTPSDIFMKELETRLMDLHNNTRMWILKGHTPYETVKKDEKCMEPLLPEACYPTPRESNVVDIGTRTKVGRNDPCPCGSGKKYKKCCLS